MEEDWRDFQGWGVRESGKGSGIYEMVEYRKGERRENNGGGLKGFHRMEQEEGEEKQSSRGREIKW